MNKHKFLEYRISRLEKMLKNEAKQVGTLYHVCTLKAYLEWIAPYDMLQASGKYYNWIYGGNDFVSFTRDKYFVVSTKSVQQSKVLIQLVIDGDKLSEKYKVGPYNDFAFGPKGEPVDDSDAVEYREKEEVVRGPINNLSKYIKEIRVDVFDMDSSALSMIRRAKLDGPNVKYFHFIKDFQAQPLTKWLKENGVVDGMPLSEAMVKFKEYVDREKNDELLFSHDVDDIEKAVRRKANLNIKYPSGYVLEEYVTDDDESDIVEYLVQSGANPNMVMGSSTPLTMAADYDCPEIIEVLVNNGADIELKDSLGETPLTAAVIKGNKSSVAKLISLGADVNSANNNGDTPLSLASSKQIMNMLKKAGAI